MRLIIAGRNCGVPDETGAGGCGFHAMKVRGAPSAPPQARANLRPRPRHGLGSPSQANSPALRQKNPSAPAKLRYIKNNNTARLVAQRFSDTTGLPPRSGSSPVPPELAGSSVGRGLGRGRPWRFVTSRRDTGQAGRREVIRHIHVKTIETAGVDDRVVVAGPKMKGWNAGSPQTNDKIAGLDLACLLPRGLVKDVLFRTEGGNRSSN